MASAPSKNLSPAELMKLEQAFAADPASQAYQPLAEAYLGMGRFMEAMVVCKKGVKAHTTSPEPRLLLARVYAEQGKDKKALEELAAAQQIAPTDKNVLRMTGSLQMKSGEADAGRANLLKAYAVDPADAETLAALSQWKVEPPRAAPPEPEPPTERIVIAAGAPIPGPGAMPPPAIGRAPSGAQPAAPPRLEQAAPRPSGEVPVLRPTGERPRPTPRVSNGPSAAPARAAAPAISRPATSSRPAARPAPRPAAREVREYDESDEYEAEQAPRRKSGATKYIFFTLAAALPLVLAAYFFVGQWQARRNREFNKHLQSASEQLKHDSYESYKRAADAADKALEIHPDSGSAHSYLAYGWSIRWGEHGGGDEARAAAERHLASAKAAGETSSHLYAADALIQNYAGKGGAALSKLRDQVKAFDAEGKQSSLLYLTLGILQMNQADLEGARESLEKAQQLAPDDPRIYSALGGLYRRRGQDRLAWQMYDFALRYEKDHPESLLGRSLLILDQDEPAYDVASKMLQKLIEADPPPSPRQLASAYSARALLVSRVSREMAEAKGDRLKLLAENTAVPTDSSKARAEIVDLEDRAAKLDRQNPELLAIKGQRLRLEGNVDGSVAALKEAISMDSSRAQFHLELAKVLTAKAGGEREAKAALEQALKSMDSPKLRVMLGDVNRKLGRADDAIAEYTKALADPKTKNPEARLALGSLYRERRAFDKAQEHLEKAAQEYVSQPAQAAAAYTELGRTFEEQRNRAKAEDAYQKALNADVEYAPAYFFYARFLSADRASAGKARVTAQEYLKREPKGEHAAEAQRIVSG